MKCYSKYIFKNFLIKYINSIIDWVKVDICKTLIINIYVINVLIVYTRVLKKYRDIRVRYTDLLDCGQ